MCLPLKKDFFARLTFKENKFVIYYNSKDDHFIFSKLVPLGRGM